MRYRYFTADVFTNRIFGGNPLAVLPDARGLTADQMQKIAGEFNLSETTFVLPPENPSHTRRVRIFTPRAEIPFAGHPTVGTAFVLASIGEVSSDRVVFAEGVGPVPVSIRYQDGRPVFSQLTAARIPEPGPQPPDPDELAAVLSLEPGDLVVEDQGSRGFSAGLPFLFVPVRSLDALGRARIDSASWLKTLSGWWCGEVFVFFRAAGTIRARMFAPGFGVPEDPATGSAAAAFAGYLFEADGKPAGTLRWTIEQGVEMGRPSLLEVEADAAGGRLTAVRVGGSSVMVSDGGIEVPA